jgi:cyclase
MFRPRLIPVLLVRNNGLVKTVRFGKSQYLGDPLNAVQIFNKFKTDELIILDIDATKQNRTIPASLVKEIGDESYMPFAVGGGINSLKKAEELINAGAEKVVINSAFIENPSLITEIANVFGSQSVIVSVDIKKGLLGKEKAYTQSGTNNTKMSAEEVAKLASEYGAGEIMITNIAHEGVMEGLDLDLVNRVSRSVHIPVIAHGGVYSLDHFKAGIEAGASAVAGGSFFVYSGRQKGILINYPTQSELKELFNYQN